MQNKSKFSVLDRTFSWLLSVMMVFGVLFVAPITSVTAYTSHSRDEAVDWAKSKIGSYIDLDGYPASNPYQCVDLIKAYYQYLGVSSVSGNGCDYSHNSLPNGWTRIQNTPTFVPNPGDIVVWTDEGWKNGHVAIFLSGNTSSFTSIDQNWPQGSAVKEVYHSSYKYVWGVIRPDFTSNPDPAPNTFHDLSKVDRGTNFYSMIIRNENWAHISDENSDARVNNNGNIVWYFSKTSDGGYTIKNVATGKYLDVNGAGDSNNVNVQTWEYNGSAAQIWYIYGPWSGEYVLKPKCTGDRVLNVYKPTGEAFIYTFDPNDKDMRFALWDDIKTYTVSYNMNGGNGSIGNQTKVEFSPLTLSGTKPTRTGYTFVGWNTSASATAAQYQPGGKYTANSGATLYAVWKSNAPTDKPVINNLKDTYNAGTNVTVTWNKVDRATSYHVSIWRNPGTEATKIIDTDVTANSYTLNNVIPGKHSIWIDAVNAGGKTTSDKYSFYVPYTIKYDVNGGTGSISSTSKIPFVDCNLSSTKPTRTGYTFVGWNTNKSATTAQYQSGGKYTANSGATLYAIWKAKTVTVTFYRNQNSSDNTTATQTFTSGVSEQSFSNKNWTKDGYTLLGWSFDRNATTNSYSITNGVINDWIDKYAPNTKLYAVWKINAPTVSPVITNLKDKYSAGTNVTVTWNKIDRATSYQVEIWRNPGTEATKIIDTTVTTNSYTLTNVIPGKHSVWIHAVNSSGKVKSDKYSFYVPYTIKYDVNGGTGSISSTSKIPFVDCNLSSTKPTRTGYTFVGWNTNKSATTAQYQSGGKYTAEGNVTLYAVWKINAPTEKPVISGLNDTYNVGKNVTINWNKIDRATSYYITIWRNPGTESSKIVDTSVTTNSYTLNNLTVGKYGIIINAKNESGTTTSELYNFYVPFTIKYDLNGGTGTIASTYKKLAVDCTLNSTKPTRTGYTFVGWNTNKSAATAQYQPGGKYTAEGDVTLYAVWQAKQVKVTFYRNQDNIDSTTATQTFTYGVSGQAFTDKNWTKDGYTLLGWSFDRNAITNTYSITNGVINNWIDQHSPNINLYAIWKINAPTDQPVISGLNETYNVGENITITWNKVDRATSYQVEIWRNPGTEAEKIIDTIVSTSTYTLTNVIPGKHSVWIYAVNDSGKVKSEKYWCFVPYTIKYDLNGGTGSIPSTSKIQFTDCNLSEAIPTRDGYDFIGWNTDASATTAQYQPGDKYSAESDAVLYAIWIKSMKNTSLISGETVPVGSIVSVIGNAENGTAPYTYAFYYKRSANTKWNVLGTEFGAATSATFKPTAAADYDIKVVVKDAKGSTDEKIMTVKVTKALTNTTVPNTEIASVGDDIRIVGTAEGGTGGYKYAFYFKRSTNSKWNTMETEFGKKGYTVLVPKAAADYDIKVVAMDSSGIKAEKRFTVSVVNELPLTNLSTVSAESVPVGKTVTAAGRFVGGTKPVTYEFYFKRSANSKWNKLSYGSESGTYAKFTPNTAAEYDIKVVVIDSKGTRISKTMKLSVQ